MRVTPLTRAWCTKYFFMIFQQNMCSKKSKPFNNVDQMWIYPPYAKNRFSLWRNLRILSIFFNGNVLHKQNLPILAIKGKLIGKLCECWPSRIFCNPKIWLTIKRCRKKSEKIDTCVQKLRAHEKCQLLKNDPWVGSIKYRHVQADKGTV